jgi:hypothetical protein
VFINHPALPHSLFLEILRSTPDTIDDVLLEVDGRWRIVNSLAPVSASMKKVELATCPAAQGQDVYYVDSSSEGEGE